MVSSDINLPKAPKRVVSDQGEGKRGSGDLQGRGKKEKNSRFEAVLSLGKNDGVRLGRRGLKEGGVRWWLFWAKKRLASEELNRNSLPRKLLQRRKRKQSLTSFIPYT